MAIIRFEDVNKRFSEVVATYMAKGLTVDLNAMSGTQGEIGKIALADDKVVYCIYADKKHTGTSFTDLVDTINIIVEMFERDQRDKVESWGVTYWLGKGTVVYEEVYYEAADRRYGKVWVDSREELDKIRELQRSRRKAQGYDWQHWDKKNYNVKIVMDVIKAKTGRKRVFEENIVSVEKRNDENCWKITYVFSGKQDYCIVKAAA